LKPVFYDLRDNSKSGLGRLTEACTGRLPAHEEK